MEGAVDVAAVVFDFDGLVMDTERCLTTSWQEEWRHHGLTLDLESFWVAHGGDTGEERLRRLAAAAGASFDPVASRERQRRRHLDLVAGLELSPGIAGWLEQARRTGLPLAIASSSSRRWVRDLLRRVGREADFSVIACGDEVPHPKPAPDVYRLALDRLAVPPERAVAVEDSAHGVAAAQAAGLRCIAIPNPHVGSTRCEAADLVLESATALDLAGALARVRRGA
jgi:HAD superfamily hydrolase (TIGR01509 family)